MMATALEMRINARVLAAVVSLVAGILFIALSMMLLNAPPEGSGPSGLLRELLFGDAGDQASVQGTGNRSEEQGREVFRFPYPFTIQNLMWLMLFIGCGEIWTRLRQAGRDQAPMDDHLLPEDPEMMLRASNLGPIYRRVNEGGYAEDAFLPRLIRRTILQFQSSRSVDQANSLLNSTLELCQHEIELRYNMLRYLVWLIPTLGFIGTVVGIAAALRIAGGADFGDQEQMQNMMPDLTSALGVAFYTTLLALLQSALLVFALHIAQAREERVLNRAGQYCLDNLINRLYEK